MGKKDKKSKQEIEIPQSQPQLRDDIFAIDKKGDKEIVNPAKQKLKELKSFKVLQPNPLIKPLKTPGSKPKRTSTDFHVDKMAKEILEKGISEPPKPAEVKTDYDLWATPLPSSVSHVPHEYLKSTTKRKFHKHPSLNFKPSSVPAVPAPHPGQSYRPDFEDHQGAMATAVARIMRHQKDGQRINDKLKVSKEVMALRGSDVLDGLRVDERAEKEEKEARLAALKAKKEEAKNESDVKEERAESSASNSVLGKRIKVEDEDGGEGDVSSEGEPESKRACGKLRGVKKEEGDESGRPGRARELSWSDKKKLKRKKREDNLRKLSQSQGELLKQVDQLPEILAEIEQEEEEAKRKLEFTKFKKMNPNMAKVKKLGKVIHRRAPLTVVRTADLPKSLRDTFIAENPMKERFDSLLERNMAVPRNPLAKKTRTKRVKVYYVNK